LTAILPGTTPVIFGRAAGRPDERIEVYLLADVEAEKADMATCIIIGSPETRIIKRTEKPALVYTPRSSTGRTK
ncbi:precorrin-3B C(17)-methyltransferase, partial [Mesorhizobium sp. M7A.F.Ca.CA.001.08.1.1]